MKTKKSDWITDLTAILLFLVVVEIVCLICWSLWG